MPVETTADTVVVALTHAPAFAHGLVRDLRVRWALEEIGRPYRAELLDAMVPRGEDYLAWQPFDQVPAFEQQGHRLFESGAILLYLGEQDERLLPATRDARWRAISWAFAALNSVEPTINQLLMVDVFLRGKPWAADASVSYAALVHQRLKRLAAALGDRDWLAGEFSIADILMVTVLRILGHTDVVAGFPNLADYVARGEARPAFARALADQLADLGEPVVLEPAG